MSVLKTILQRVQWTSSKTAFKCPSGCSRLYSKANDSKESPIKTLLDDSLVNDDQPVHLNPESVWTTTPYPERLRQKMEKEAGLDHDEMSIIMFPGQGTHYMGMGQRLTKFPKARKLFNIANEVLNVDLLKIDKQSDLFKYCQELIVVCSLAAVERLREERPSALDTCVATAGFSLGEITALIFAGAIPLEQGLRLVSVRAAAMQAASKIRPGGMLTILYTARADVKEICDKAVEHCLEEGISEPFCSIANYLYPTCKVIAGSPAALQYIEQNASDLGIRATKRLGVTGAFHSVGVEAAVEPFKQALRLCDVEKPKIRVMSGVTAKEYRDDTHIRSQLPKQISHPVKWEQLLHILYSRPQDHKFPRTFEVGPGKTLRAILKKVNAKAWDNSIYVEA